MKTKILCMALCLLAWPVAVCAAPDLPAAPELAFSAKVGASFASVDVLISLDSFDHPSIYYLALAEGAAPDAEMILAYADGRLTAGLENGRAVRGHWIASSRYNGRAFSLSGGENIKNIPGEEGFVDGSVYDIYMVAVDRGGRYSNVACARDIMAMPFEGVEGGSFVIGDGHQLANIRRLGGEFLAGSYVLASDIDLRGYENWPPITGFSGSFDGRGHRIINLRGQSGLFGSLTGAFVQNLNIVGAEIRSQSGPAGVLAGSIFADTIIVDCYVDGNVYGTRGTGVFAGTVQGSEIPENANHSIKIVRCRTSGTVEARGGMTGGFVGSMAYAAIDACDADVDVRAAGDDAGGFVGRITHRSRITYSRACGDVENIRGRQTGGFVGILTHGSGIEFSFSAGDVRGERDVGGFAGAVAAPGAPNTLFGCLSFARWICGEDYIGRLAGRLDHDGVNNCYAYLGTVVADSRALRHVLPNAYGPDGGDFNCQTLDGILKRIGWDISVNNVREGRRLPYESEDQLPRERMSA